MDLKAELAAAMWHKATASGPDGSNCIEVAPLSGDRVAIRDTETPEQTPFVVRGEAFRAWVDGARRGEFDF